MFTPIGFNTQNIVTNGLVLWLDANDKSSYPGTGTTWRDLKTNTITGSLVNGPTFNSANGGSVEFNGVNRYIEFGDVLDLGTNSLTVNQWVKLNSVSVTSVLFSKTLAGGQNYRFATGINFSTPINRLATFMQGNGGNDITPYGSTALSTNTWFMATYVFDRASSISMYYNGVQETLTGNATISQWNGLNFQSNNPLRLATYTAGNNTDVFLPTNGNIASTYIYFRVLSQQEILQNFNATRAQFGI